MNLPLRLQFFLLLFAGWANRHQEAVIDYLKEENRVLKELHGGKRLLFNDDQRRRLAVKGKALGRRLLGEVGSLVTPDTILGWYRRLIAKKYDGSQRRSPGRPRKAEEIVESFGTPRGGTHPTAVTLRWYPPDGSGLEG